MPPVLTPEANEQQRKAAGLAQRYTGWAVWSARKGNAKVATRTGDQRNPGDDAWAATLIADTWADLGAQLADQAQRDAERTYPESRP